MPPALQAEAETFARQVRSLVGLAAEHAAGMLAPIQQYITEMMRPVYAALRPYELWVVETTGTAGDIAWGTWTTCSALLLDCKGQTGEAWGAWSVWVVDCRRRVESAWGGRSGKG